jgi:putative salt-induced outer membrane protein YdiY
MMHRIWPFVVAALAAPAAGRAQAPAAAPPHPPLVRAQIDLGFVSTSGNSSVRSLNVGEQLVVKPDPWKFTQTFSIVNGYTSGVETVNTLAAGLRADYAVGSRFRLYGLGNYTRNRFAGIARRFEEAIGLSYGLLTGPGNILDFEAGAGRNQQTGSLGPLQEFWVSRLAVRYRLNLTSRAFLEQKDEELMDLENFQNLRINSESALVAPISNNVGLKLGYVVHFANQPQPGFKKADTILSAGLQLLF